MMGLTSRFFRIPRPKTFLYLMSLRTGTELSTLSLLLNKVSGLYGILALLTGLHLSSLQLSMYIYSIFALAIAFTLAPHIRTQSPFHCLALATFYVLDSVINAAYTAAFAFTWFLVLSQHLSDDRGGEVPGPGGKMMSDAGGYSSPEFNVSRVGVAPGPDQGIPGERPEVVTGGVPGSPASTAATPSLGHGVLQSESVSSIVVICALWAFRVYMCLVVMSYVRLVLRRHVANISRNSTQLYTPGKTSNMIENPFAIHFPEGKGWKGQLGRAMISVGRGYWLGSEDGDDVWMSEELAMGRTRKPGVAQAEVPGLVERERRRRSGTGPPLPMPSLNGDHAQHLRLQEARDGK